MPDLSLPHAPNTAEARVSVQDALGLHARPAGRIALAARNYSCAISLVWGEQEADAKSILDILTLAVPCGSVLTVRCQGEDAADACAALCQLFAPVQSSGLWTAVDAGMEGGNG